MLIEHAIGIKTGETITFGPTLFEFEQLNNQFNNNYDMQNNYFNNSFEEYYNEFDNEFDNQDFNNDVAEEFAEVLEELLMGEYESEFEASETLDEELELMANEYFTKRVNRKRKRRGRHNKRKGGFLGNVLRAGGKFIKKHGKKILKGALNAIPIPGAGLIGGAIVDAAIKDEFAEFAEYDYSPQEIANITKEAYEFMADDFIVNSGEYEID